MLTPIFWPSKCLHLDLFFNTKVIKKPKFLISFFSTCHLEDIRWLYKIFSLGTPTEYYFFAKYYFVNFSVIFHANSDQPIVLAELFKFFNCVWKLKSIKLNVKTLAEKGCFHWKKNLFRHKTPFRKVIGNIVFIVTATLNKKNPNLWNFMAKKLPSIF